MSISAAVSAKSSSSAVMIDQRSSPLAARRPGRPKRAPFCSETKADARGLRPEAPWRRGSPSDGHRWRRIQGNPRCEFPAQTRPTRGRRKSEPVACPIWSTSLGIRGEDRECSRESPPGSRRAPEAGSSADSAGRMPAVGSPRATTSIAPGQRPHEPFQATAAPPKQYARRRRSAPAKRENCRVSPRPCSACSNNVAPLERFARSIAVQRTRAHRRPSV